jgi:phosphomannomutase
MSNSKQTVTPQVLSMLQTLRKRVVLGFVGGSDFPKQLEQLGDDSRLNIDDMREMFSNNRLCSFGAV